MAAVNLYVEKAHEISNRKTAQAVERTKGENPAAAKELAAYVEAISGRTRPKTLENYATQLAVIARKTGKPFSKLTNEDVRNLFRSIERMSNGTKYATYQALRSYFCDYCKYDRQMDKDLTSKWERLMDNIKRPGPSKRLLTQNDLLSPEDLDKLLSACRNPRDKAFLLCLYESGARLSELLSMQVCDINFNAQPVEIKIRHSKTEDKKGRRPVYIFRAEPLLKQWLEQHPLNNHKPGFYTSNTPVWVSWMPTHGSTDTMTTNTAGLMLDRLKTRAGIPKQRDLFAHLFRHTRASDLHNNYGLDVKEIKEILGHSKIETTDGYLTLNRNVLIQKLQGHTDAALEERRQEALKRGQPMPCACGVTNDPQAAFCYKCGRVVNQDIAKELIKRKEQESAAKEQEIKELREQMGAMREEIKNRNVSDVMTVVLHALQDPAFRKEWEATIKEPTQ